jgi:hypothetical protein
MRRARDDAFFNAPPSPAIITSQQAVSIRFTFFLKKNNPIGGLPAVISPNHTD